MDHVPPPNVWAVQVVRAADEGRRVAVQDAFAIWELRLPALPVPLHHLLGRARTALQDTGDVAWHAFAYPVRNELCRDAEVA